MMIKSEDNDIKTIIMNVFHKLGKKKDYVEACKCFKRPKEKF
jgi:hypothetical protein